MQLKKRILPKLLLLFLVGTIICIVSQRSHIRQLRSFNIERIKIHIDNFFFYAGPNQKRRMPISLARQETELKLYIGQPFLDFSDEDWNNFWRIIYGGFPVEDSANPRLPKKKRQLEEEEIRQELIYLYPSPFTTFRSEHWKMFFEIVFRR